MTTIFPSAYGIFNNAIKDESGISTSELLNSYLNL